MNAKTFKETVFDYATKKGLKEYELFTSKSHEFECSVSKGEIQSYKDAENGGSSFKAVKNGKAGYSYTEDLSSEEAHRIVDDALENLELIESEEQEIVYDQKTRITDWEDYDMAFEKIDPLKKIEDVKKLEKIILDKDDRILMVPYCYNTNTFSEVYFANSYGAEYNYITGGGGMYSGAMASNGKQNKFGMAFGFSKNPEKIDIEKIATETAEKTVSLLDAKSLKSGKYDVVLDNDVFSDLLGLFIQMISAENVQKGLSLLNGKLGEKVASELLSIRDVRSYTDSIFDTPADAQGVVTQDKDILRDGVLKTFLHSLKTAAKDGVKPTGNAFRSSYKGTETISPVNIDVKSGLMTLEKLFATLNDGVYITNVQGMHSGANPISGEFSVGAQGFRIEGGRKSFPVEQITLSGNLLSMLQSIKGVGSDKKMAFAMSSGIFTPSVLVDKMDIAGNE
ncbi:MAG TPA: TldD/PmbA family protein [Thermotogota bacterium]|nr:TldD/PmbA family protein [Thermotogota bacterium]HPJ87994.1 TldD/PmbA family protein [Thermotogota bacterium]